MADHARKPVRKPARNTGRRSKSSGGGLKIAAFAVLAAAISAAVYMGANLFSGKNANPGGTSNGSAVVPSGTNDASDASAKADGSSGDTSKADDSTNKDGKDASAEAGKGTSASTGNAKASDASAKTSDEASDKSDAKGAANDKDGSSAAGNNSGASSAEKTDAGKSAGGSSGASGSTGTNDAASGEPANGGTADGAGATGTSSTGSASGGGSTAADPGTAPSQPSVFIPVFNYPNDGSWIKGEACASSVDEAGTSTASQIPFDDDVPQVGLERSTGAYDHLGDYVEIRYDGTTVRAQVVDCGGYNGGNTGIMLNPAVFYQFGVWSSDEWGRRPVEFRFVD